LKKDRGDQELGIVGEKRGGSEGDLEDPKHAIFPTSDLGPRKEFKAESQEGYAALRRKRKIVPVLLVPVEDPMSNFCFCCAALLRKRNNASRNQKTGGKEV